MDFPSYSTQKPKVIVIWAAIQPPLSQVGCAVMLSRRFTYDVMLHLFTKELNVSADNLHNKNIRDVFLYGQGVKSKRAY